MQSLLQRIQAPANLLAAPPLAASCSREFAITPTAMLLFYAPVPTGPSNDFQLLLACMCEWAVRFASSSVVIVMAEKRYIYASTTFHLAEYICATSLRN